MAKQNDDYRFRSCELFFQYFPVIGEQENNRQVAPSEGREKEDKEGRGLKSGRQQCSLLGWFGFMKSAALK